MTSIRPDRDSYALQRRYVRKKGGKPLKGFAMDLVVRFNSEETAFLQDLNSDRNVMPFTNVDDLVIFLAGEIKRNHDEHYAAAWTRDGET
ncbi:MAG: hypothetical protein ACLQVF_02265 [Isosphaeraceae bacterium]